MNLSITYRIIALVLACMVFLSTSMSSMRLHFCGGKVAGIGLFDSALAVQSCCADKVDTCDMASDQDCCEDEYIDLDWEVDIAIQSDLLTDNTADIIAALSYTYNYSINSPQATSSPKTYIPPLPQEKRSILFQQFLL